MNVITPSIVQFDLPQRLACPLPTEERKIERDEVRLLVTKKSGEIDHTIFKHFDDYLQRGDVLVVNTSATIPAAFPVQLPDGREGRLHLSTKVNEKKWLVEIREVTGNKTSRWYEGEQGMIFRLPSGASITLKEKFYKNEKWLNIWVAELNTNQSVQSYISLNGQPIQYDKLDRQYPLSYYQTFFSFHPGSSEMPSAGRGFTKAVIKKLQKKGVLFAPIILHTGISSLEENELPYPEYMEIDPVSASIINNAKGDGGRIIAVGTTCVRAIETATNDNGIIQPFRGNTELFIDESYEMKITDGLLTGFHEPRASHLNMLQAIGGFEHLENAYMEAISAGYYWHQFGDLHLMLP
jgi:S-adenosylmethionine:tRNA ribosyltransferase-isomerase